MGKLSALASWVAVKRGKRKRAVEVDSDTDTDFEVNSGFWESVGKLKIFVGVEEEEEEGGGRGDFTVAEALSAIAFQPLATACLSLSLQ